MAGLRTLGKFLRSRFPSRRTFPRSISYVNLFDQGAETAQGRDSCSWFVFGRRARARFTSTSFNSLARIDTTLWVRYSAFQMSWPSQESRPYYSCSGLSHTECFSDEQVSPFAVNQ